MSAQRIFFDWNRPWIDAVVPFLANRYTRAGGLEMDRAICVVPTARSGRLLLEALVAHADEHDLVLLPPEITTIGSLPERLYESKFPFASDLVQRLAWAAALRSKRTGLSSLLSNPPDESSLTEWLELADALGRQHRELAADILNFGDVANELSGREMRRWKTLRKIQEDYLQTLDGLELWDAQTARVYAIEHEECRTDHDIVLIATADLNTAQRAMLTAVADRVTACVHAPNDFADRFDDLGAILPEAWLELDIDLETADVRVAVGPTEQAVEVVQALARTNGKYRGDQIAIAIPETNLLPEIDRQLRQAGVKTRSAFGTTVSQTSPLRLINLIADFADRGRWRDFAALVRHADIADWLATRDVPLEWLSRLDEYFNSHLPPQLGEWLGQSQARFATEKIALLIENLTAPCRKKERPLAEWSEVIAALLKDVYGQRRLRKSEPAEDQLAKALMLLQKQLEEIRTLPLQLSVPASLRQVVDLLEKQFAGQSIADPADAAAIELFGWLDVPHDGAKCVVVTSFNEGFIPQNVNADVFLPNRMRKKLKLTDNDRRYARDAYALLSLLHQTEDLTLVVARRDASGDPLIPSRLLLRSDPQEIAERVKRYFGELPSRNVPPVSNLTPAVAETQIFVPQPPSNVPIPTSLRVTSLRDYLVCPYRFYLRHILGLEQLNDKAEGMEPMSFGTLLHNVLDRFGESELSDSTNANEIADFLDSSLTEIATKLLGRNVLPAVAIQLMQARLRLKHFAEWQANWRAAGWRIEHVEQSPDAAGVPVELPDVTFSFRGRIDRIDRHETGTWAIFDYKSSETKAEPESYHREGRDKRWKDLQLPMYRHLAKPLGVDGDVRLGYISLPKDVSAIGHAFAEWTDEDLAEADQKAAEIVKSIQQGKFWPPERVKRGLMSEFDAICQTAVAGAAERMLEAQQLAQREANAISGSVFEDEQDLEDDASTWPPNDRSHAEG